MKSSDVRKKYLDFFIKEGHKVIPSSSLIPENDPTTLFISAGMQPLIPYLLGEEHPMGKRIVNCQKCLRTDDIEEVGDKVHHTFFEMLGNWSLGDYFKEDAIKMSFDLLTSSEGFNIPKGKLAISVFAGDQDASFDSESFRIWLSLGIPEERIAKLPKKNNWWGPAGDTGPCGPDTEMFVWTGKADAPKEFDPEDNNWVEVWNDVFMEYNKTFDGKFEKLGRHNVDTGMGLERMLAVLNRTDDDYKTDLFLPIIEFLERETGNKYSEVTVARDFRVIADHIKAATFLIKDGVIPSNKQQGYILRRLLRRAGVKLSDYDLDFVSTLANLSGTVIDIYEGTDYFAPGDSEKVKQVITEELERFEKTIKKGLKEIEKLKEIDGKIAFDLYQTYGFPKEITAEVAKEKGQEINFKEFEEEFKKHQELSRTTSAGLFKGGLADEKEKTTKLHTTNHIMQAALRQILGTHIRQHGSNITTERLRYDFSHDQKLTDEEIKKVEDLVNEQIKKDLPVHFDIEDRDEAIKKGALTNVGEAYPEKAKVYKIGTEGSYFSKELCGGPHVEHTGIIGKFKILKQENLGSGLRRIYATVGD